MFKKSKLTDLILSKNGKIKNNIIRKNNFGFLNIK